MFDLPESDIGGVPRHAVPTWERSGVFHGFLGKTVDVGIVGQWERAFPGVKLLLLNQVHGTKWIEIRSPSDFEHTFASAVTENAADGWLFDMRSIPNGTAFGIKSADCFPVLLYDPGSELLGAVHCGWRGAVAGLLMQILGAFGQRRDRIELAIGPGAQACCYEVGTDVAAKYYDALQSVRGTVLLDESVPSDVRGRTHFATSTHVQPTQQTIGLQELLIAQALYMGVKPDLIYLVRDCTICSADYFSFRRQGRAAGRQVSFIGKNAPC